MVTIEEKITIFEPIVILFIAGYRILVAEINIAIDDKAIPSLETVE